MPRYDKSPLTFKATDWNENQTDNLDAIETDQIRVVAKDGRTAFVIRLLDCDEPSIEVAVVGCVKVNDKFYEGLVIVPTASNRIIVKMKEDR